MTDDLLPLLDTLRLTWLGAFHSIVSIVALVAGLLSMIFLGRIKPTNAFGRLYIVSTALVCASGFGIYATGAFGKPHILGIITIVFLYLAGLAHQTNLFRSFSLSMEAFCLTATFCFHVLSAITEIATRYPFGKPWIEDREGPELKFAALGTLAAIFIIGMIQAAFLRKK